MILPIEDIKTAVPESHRGWCALLLALTAPCFLTSCLVIPGHGEKQIRYELTHRFAVEDPQFVRSMGQIGRAHV